MVSSAQGSGEDAGYTIYTAVAELGGKEYIEVQKVINTYTVKFLNYDGTTLQTLTAEHGSTPEYTGSEPAREKTAQYSYSFIG